MFSRKVSRDLVHRLPYIFHDEDGIWQNGVYLFNIRIGKNPNDPWKPCYSCLH